jgi:hypothetical protein
MDMPIPNNDAPFVPRMQEILVDMLNEARHSRGVLERQYEETRREQALSNRANIERHQQLLHMLNLRQVNVNPPAQGQPERAFRPEGNINANQGIGGHGIEANRRQVNHGIPAPVPLRHYAPQIANQPLPNARACGPNVPNAPQAGAVNQPQINNLHDVMAHVPRQNVNVINPPVGPGDAPHVNAYCQAHGNGNGRAGFNHHLKTISVPKYTGSADAKTPYDFLVEMDRYKAISRSTEEFMLHEIVPAALEGTAYHWYRSEVSIVPFHTWEEFKLKFRREFQTLGYAEQMRRALERRTQGSTEPLTMFIRVIADFYERLEMPVTEDEIIKRVLRQAHPQQYFMEGQSIP